MKSAEDTKQRDYFSVFRSHNILSPNGGYNTNTHNGFVCQYGAAAAGLRPVTNTTVVYFRPQF
jgi:hypothetical protein